MRNTLLSASLVLLIASATFAQEAAQLRPDTLTCHYIKAPLLDDGRSDARTIAEALMFECTQELIRRYASTTGRPAEDPLIGRIMKENRDFDLGRAISAVLVIRAAQRPK
jgi:hypothetical protein